MKKGITIPHDMMNPDNLKHIGTIAGLVTAVIVGFYVTGIIRNVKQIKKLNQVDSAPLKPEEL